MLRHRIQALWQLLRAVVLGALAMPAFGAAAECGDPASTMLWEVQGTGLAQRGVSIHLFGSIHVGKADFYPLPAVVDERFRLADTLVFEVDPRSMATPAALKMIQQRGVLPADRTLDQELDVATMASLRRVLQQTGLPEAQVLHMKPWMVTLTLSALQVQQLGYDANLGVESYLMQHRPPAAAIGELESLDSQLTLMESLDPKVFLRYSLEDFANSTEQMEQMVNAWRCGDHDALAAIMFPARDSGDGQSAADKAAMDQLMYRMFDERNAGMAARIGQYLKTGTGDYFVVVGAGHLLGEGSVLELLQQQGYQVTPVRAPRRRPAG